MSDTLSAGLRQYYKEISASLVCSAKQKKLFIADLSMSINDFVAENPECTVEDIKLNFGSCEEICRSFMENNSSVQIKKKLGVKKVIIVAVALALLIWLAFAVISLVDVHQEAHGTFKEGMLYVEALARWIQ